MLQTESVFSISKKRRRLESSFFLKPVFTVLLSIASIATIAVAGSLTPPAAPASTFHTLEEIYNSIAGTFDSSGITSSTTGSLIQGIKSINSNLAWASGSNNVWALNSGNVGIGTTSPTTKLDILGSASVSVNFEVDGFASASSFKLPSTAGGSLGDCDAAGDTLNWDTTTGKFVCGTDTSGSVASNSLDFDELVDAMTLDANLTIASTSNNYTWDFLDTQVSFAGGIIMPNGNVGIGTTAPAAKLSVVGEVVDGGIGTLSVTPGNHTNVASEINSLVVNGNILNLSTSLALQRFNYLGQPTIEKNGGLSVTINDAATLAIAAPPTASGESAGIDNSHGLLIQTGSLIATNNGYGLTVNAPTGALFNYAAVFSGGNVGIGTTAPTERLQVSGKVLSTNTEVQGTSSASYGLFGALQVAGFSSTSYSRFGTNTTGHSLSASQDLLLSGLLEVDGQAYFDSNASVSGTFEITKLGTTGDHFKLTDSANDKSYGLVVRDGDLMVRAPSISDAFSSRYSIASVASNSLGWTLGTPASPSLAGSYATAQIALDIYVQGKYAYVPIDVSGIQIIDVSNPHSPVLMSTLDTSGTALGVYVSGRYLYVGDSTAGLHIIDVSNPKNPIRVGTYNTSGNAENIYISGKYAYVTDNASGLQIIDVSNPSNPTLVSTYDTPDLAEGIYVSGKYAYIGDNTTFRILDISNPSSPTLVGVYDTPDGALGIYVSGKYAYVGGGNTGLVVLDVSNPSSPTLVSTFATTFAESVYVSGEYAYVADSSGGVKIVDVSNPSVPTLAGSYTFSTNVLDVYVSGKYVYAAGHAGGLKILDIGGLETHALYAGNINTSDITISENVDIGNSLLVRNGLNVGNGGLLVNGPIALSASFSANTASLSASDLFTITHSKGRLTGDALQVDLAASTSQEFFTGNFANFTIAGTTRILFESSGSVLASGAAQFGSAGAPSSVSYSRFGTGTTGHSLSAASDLLISGSLEVDGVFNVDQLSDQHGFIAAGTGNNRVTIRNTTAGTGNYASFAVMADDANTGGNNQFFSTTYSTSGSEIADSYRVISLGTGGLSLAASSSGGGVIRFYSGSFSAERARFDQIGRLGLGTTTPLQELHIASGSDGNLFRLQDSDGTCDHNPEAGAETVTCSSDSRLKDNIVDAAPILNRIRDIRIRDYTVKASGDQMTGVIAQEIRETWPEMVASGSDGFLMVRQPSTWQIIKAIQEQQAQISEIASKSSMADEPFLNSIASLFEKVFGIIFKNGLVQSIRGAFGTVETDRLCVGNTCVTEKELIDLLQKVNVPQARPTTQPTPTPTPTVAPIPYVDPTPTPTDAIPTPTPTPDVSPTVSPAPADVTPIPTPTDILPIISPTPTPTSVPTPTPADVTPIPTPIPTPVPSETPVPAPVTTPTDVPPII